MGDDWGVCIFNDDERQRSFSLAWCYILTIRTSVRSFGVLIERWGDFWEQIGSIELSLMLH
jgi:hypothetical protein